MKVLGIDFSLNGTGLSIFDGQELIFNKVFTTVKKNYETYKDIFILSPKFKSSAQKLDWVCHEIINCTDYDFVCMEDHIGAYYEWMDGYGIIKHYLRKNNKDYIMISPTQLKKYAVSGKADKNCMINSLNEEHNIDLNYIGPLANNIADATWLSIVGLNYYNKFILKQEVKINNNRLQILQKLNDKFGEQH